MVSVESLDLSRRSINRLAMLGIEFIGDIVSENKTWTDRVILNVPGVGRKAFGEIRRFIDDYQAKLTPIRGWKRPDKSSRLDNAVGLSNSELLKLKDYERLTTQQKKPYMVSVESLDLSRRSINRLAMLGIEFIGDIVSENKTWTDRVILNVPGVGRKAFGEIRRFIDDYQAKLTPIRGWTRPEKKPESSLELVETPEGMTLEDELSFALQLVAEPYKQELVAARFGVGRFENRHTLQELGDGSFWPDGKPRTRERARQVIKKTLGKICSNNISFSTLKVVEAIVKKRPFWTQKVLGRELNAVDIASPKQLFRTLKALQAFSYSEPFVIREGVVPTLFASERTKSQFDADKASIRGLYRDKLFLPISKVKKIPSFANVDLREFAELGLPSVVCKSEGGEEFVARKIARLKTHASYPNTMIAKIFSLTSQVRLEFLIEAVLSSSGRKPGSIPNDDRVLLNEYLHQQPYLIIEDGLVRNVQRPLVSYLRDADLAIISCVREYGVEINTDELHRWLLTQLNCTEQSARQKAMFSPLLVTLSKGRGNRPGIKRLVCDLADIDQIRGEYSKPSASLKIILRNSIRLKRTGETRIEEEVADGHYPVVLSDDPDNDIALLKVSNGRVYNLQDIANAYDTDRFTFTFDSDHGVFSLQK